MDAKKMHTYHGRDTTSPATAITATTKMIFSSSGISTG